MADISVLNTFQVVTRPMFLKPKDRKPAELGPKVRVETVHLSPAADESSLLTIINAAGMRDLDKDGLKEHNTDPLAMWLGMWTTNLSIEFELPETVPLSGISIWNYNAEWQTTNGVRKLDVSVSVDGNTWQPCLAGAELAEAEGTADYDTPIVLKLNNVIARKIRFENIVPLGNGGKVGLSEVVFHQSLGKRAGVVEPEDGLTDVGLRKVVAEWIPGEGGTEHHVLMGSSPDSLSPYRTTRQTRFKFDDLKSDSVYFWRVDEPQADGTVVTGRVARFETLKTVPVVWWKLDESEGALARDSASHKIDGSVQGQPRWSRGRIGGAMEFDGSSNFINCGSSPEFNFNDGIAICAWVKVRKFDKAWQTIVAKGDKSWKLQRYKEQDTVAFSLRGVKSETDAWMDEPTISLVSKRKINDGQWHFLVGSYDGRSAVLYIDGEQEDFRNVSGSLTQNAEPVSIGENTGAPGQFFNGWLDDLRLYNHGVSVDVVKELYQEGQQ